MCLFDQGKGKPWLAPTIVKTPTSSLEWWWYVLEEVNRELEMGLNFDEWDLGMPSTSLHRRSLGDLVFASTPYRIFVATHFLALGVFSKNTDAEVAQRNSFLQQ